MTPAEFKKRWSPDNLNRWTDFALETLNRLPVSQKTKAWLKEGFPEDAAPYLSFGLRSYDDRFYSVAEYYSEQDLDTKTSNYWIIGSDGGGNPICIDSASHDRILLLDHEQAFEKIGVVNVNVRELAHCLFAFKEFIANIKQELGSDAYIGAKYTQTQVANLKKRLEEIDPELLLNSDFWEQEIENLLAKIS